PYLRAAGRLRDIRRVEAEPSGARALARRFDRMLREHAGMIRGDDRQRRIGVELLLRRAARQVERTAADDVAEQRRLAEHVRRQRLEQIAISLRRQRLAVRRTP